MACATIGWWHQTGLVNQKSFCGKGVEQLIFFLLHRPPGKTGTVKLRESRLMLHRIKKSAVGLWRDESGASLLEYSLLIGLVAVVTVTTIGAVGTWVTGRWTTLKTALGVP